jgi:site-specific DNA recombinase
MYDIELKEYSAHCGVLSSKAMEAKAHRGEFPGCAPIGYKNTCTENGAKTIVIDDAFDPLIKETFELAAVGKYSLRKLLKMVTDTGFRK